MVCVCLPSEANGGEPSEKISKKILNYLLSAFFFFFSRPSCCGQFCTSGAPPAHQQPTQKHQPTTHPHPTQPYTPPAHFFFPPPPRFFLSNTNSIHHGGHQPNCCSQRGELCRDCAIIHFYLAFMISILVFLLHSSVCRCCCCCIRVHPRAERSQLAVDIFVLQQVQQL